MDGCRKMQSREFRCASRGSGPEEGKGPAAGATKTRDATRGARCGQKKRERETEREGEGGRDEQRVSLRGINVSREREMACSDVSSNL